MISRSRRVRDSKPPSCNTQTKSPAKDGADFGSIRQSPHTLHARLARHLMFPRFQALRIGARHRSFPTVSALDHWHQFFPDNIGSKYVNVGRLFVPLKLVRGVA